MNLDTWMRRNFDTVRGLTVETARRMASDMLGHEVTKDEIGHAFIRLDFERRGMKIDEGWKHARREDLPREEELRRERIRKSPRTKGASK